MQVLVSPVGVTEHCVCYQVVCRCRHRLFAGAGGRAGAGGGAVWLVWKQRQDPTHRARRSVQLRGDLTHVVSPDTCEW